VEVRAHVIRSTRPIRSGGRGAPVVLALVASVALTIPLTIGSAAASVRRAQRLGGETVEVAGVWTGTEQKNFEKVLGAFEKQTGASATFTSTGDDISSALAPRIASGNAPEVAILPQPGLLKDYAQQGVLQPLPAAVGEEVDANYAPIWRQLGTMNGRLYGVWFKAANKSLVWYNAKVFRDAGVKPATTFDQLSADLKTIANSGVAPLSVGGESGWPLTDIFENLYLAQEGPAKYDQLASHSIPWTDPSVTDTLRTMGQLVESSNLAGGASGTLETDFAASVQNVFANPPKGAMTIEGDFVAAAVPGSRKAKANAKFFPFPPMNGGQPSVVTGGDVAVMFKDTPAARALMKFLASPASAEVWARQGGYISPNKNVKPSAYPDKTTRDIANELITAHSVRFDMSDQQPAAFGATAGQGEWKLFQDFVSDPGNVEGIAQQLESAAAQAYGAQKQ
jgi:ABC-type glycerol-3-phosphate transport system substrate-binding protein